jgi:hypothetical protein
VAVKTRGRGRWHVKGRYSNAASYATAWTTTEACDRTITRVLSGHVRVFDRVRRRTVDLGPGQHYVARARP